jgi:tellurite resistance protein TehA-like permease
MLKPMGSVSTFITLVGLGTCVVAFLLRFSQIAFPGRTTLHYLVFVFSIIALFAALIAVVKYLIIVRGSANRNSVDAGLEL